ncbi:MAG: FAD-dependent oxidoreductase [Sphingobacteriales bacterium]
MKETDVLIIGAGAAGLMAAYMLSKAGKKVMILEACKWVGDGQIVMQRIRLAGR